MRAAAQTLAVSVTVFGFVSGYDVSEALTRRVPLDVATIQSALDLSSSGESVLVAPGTYAERLTLPPGVTLRAEAGVGSVTVDAEDLAPCIVSAGGVLGSRLEGVRLVHGAGQDDGGVTVGGALRVIGGVLDVSDCELSSSTAQFGGGSAATMATVTFVRCRWAGTNASFGGGHFQAGGSVRLTDAVLEDVTANAGGAAYATLGAYVTMQTARITRAFAHGDGGGLHLDSGVASLSDVVFDAARADGHGGGIAVAAGGQMLASFCAFVDNESGLGGGAFYVSCAASSPGPVTTGADCALLTMTHVDVLTSRGAAPAAGAVTDAAVVRIERSIIAGNASGLACLDSRATLDVQCSSLDQNGIDLAGPCAPAADPANLSADPHLCDLAGRDFQLCSNSVLLAPGCGTDFWGYQGEGCTACGPSPAERSSWGRLKARYHR